MDKKVFATHRRDKLVALLEQHHSLSTQQLAEYMQVSTITVRRDLEQLEVEGLLERVHGGAVIVRHEQAQPDEPAYQVKIGLLQAEKTAIAQRAAAEVEDRSLIILDSGTTCLALAKQLAGRNLTVIALDTQVAQAAASGVTQVHLVGGHVRNGLFSLVGPWAEEILQHLHAEIFFMGADAITPDGVTNSMVEEAQIKRMASERSQRTILLADHSKIGRRSLARVIPMSAVDMLITDSKASPVIGPYHQVLNKIELV